MSLHLTTVTCLRGPKQGLSYQASYALETIHTIVNTASVLHVAFSPPPATPDSPAFPAILPMIGRMGSFARPSAANGDVLDLYLHGYVSSRLMGLGRAAGAAAAGEGDGASGAGETQSQTAPQQPQQRRGIPVCVSATHVDGLVLALTPNSHSLNYRSAVLFGYAVAVSDPAERLWAMELLTDGVLPGRWQGSRTPPNAAELQSTTVLKVTIEAGSAKIRTGMPSDEKADLENEEVTGRVWTGVVPMYSVFGEPVAGGGGRVEKVPEYIADFVNERNEESRRMAVEEATWKAMDKGTKKGEE